MKHLDVGAMPFMRELWFGWAAAATLTLSCAALAADAPSKPAPNKPTTKSATQPAANAQQRADRAKGMALATETVQRISEAQLQVADRVLTGDAQCEFGQRVSVKAGDVQIEAFHFAEPFDEPDPRLVLGLALGDRAEGLLQGSLGVRVALLEDGERDGHAVERARGRRDR